MASKQQLRTQPATWQVGEGRGGEGRRQGGSCFHEFTRVFFLACAITPLYLCYTSHSPFNPVAYHFFHFSNVLLSHSSHYMILPLSCSTTLTYLLYPPLAYPVSYPLSPEQTFGLNLRQNLAQQPPAGVEQKLPGSFQTRYVDQNVGYVVECL